MFNHEHWTIRNGTRMVSRKLRERAQWMYQLKKITNVNNNRISGRALRFAWICVNAVSAHSHYALPCASYAKCAPWRNLAQTHFARWKREKKIIFIRRRNMELMNKYFVCNMNINEMERQKNENKNETEKRRERRIQYFYVRKFVSSMATNLQVSSFGSNACASIFCCATHIWFVHSNQLLCDWKWAVAKMCPVASMNEHIHWIPSRWLKTFNIILKHHGNSFLLLPFNFIINVISLF